jgi:type I restriction enzyme, R subunit
MKHITESEIEQIALDILNEELGYTVLYGPDLADGAHKEREFGDVALNHYKTN